MEQSRPIDDPDASSHAVTEQLAGYSLVGFDRSSEDLVVAGK